jgi:isopentenyldiphosphate isomerase
VTEIVEQLDVLDATGRRIGVAGRDAVHRDGAWHQVVHCLVVRSAAPARVVLQVRSFESSTYPGRLDLSATGHVQAGEAPVDGMLREIEEELGISVNADALVPLGRRLLADDRGPVRNREIMHVFLLADDRPLAEFHLDAEHAGGLVEIDVADLLRVLADPTASVDAASMELDGSPVTRRVGWDDLVPPLDGYWAVVSVMAQRFVAGESPLAI